MKLKLCGLRREIDVEMVNAAHPDYAGFILAPSRRRVSPLEARELGKGLRSDIKKVGVFVNEPLENLGKIADAALIDVIQLHGDEDEDYICGAKKIAGGREIWKAVRVQSAQDVRDAERLSADMLLYDSFAKSAYGGTGKPINLSAVLDASPKRKFFLAGGINAENAADIIRLASPYGLDVSSGFEVDGFKNAKRLDEFLNAIERRG